jgi:hypothetical protein
MRVLLGLVALALSVPLGAAAPPPPDPSNDAIAQALLPLPDSLKAGATVVTYDKATGERQVLRQGTNAIECQPKAADGFTRCYHKALAPRRDLEARLHAQGKSDKEIQDAVAAAQKAGTLKPPPYGTMMYRYTTDTDRIKVLWVMLVPNATAESTGLTTESQRESALKGQGSPWLMNAGTPGAHVMIPINK